MYGYIYMIVNKINGKTYIGKHKLYKKAWNEDGYPGSGILLKSAQEKYGLENFEKFLICYTESEEDACEKEKFWIAEYRSRGKAEYNITDGGDGWSGGHHSEEAKRKISEAQKRVKHGPFSEEHKKNISERNKGKHGGPLSEIHKRKISEAKKGKHISEEVLKRRSETVKGKHWYNNGTKSIMSKACPEGFVPGRLK